MTDDRPLILTARLDDDAQAHFDALRRAHFPPARNFLAAHLTLFHHLPGAQIEAIGATLAAQARSLPALAATAASLRSLGNGVAFRIECDALLALRQSLAAAWSDWLTPQDRQKFQPHVTVQNKVPADAARALLDELSAGFAPVPLALTGLDLWHYDGGPWTIAQSFPFAARGT